MSVIETVLKSIATFISKLAGWVKTTTSDGTTIANEIKTIIDNPAWDVAVSFTATNVDNQALAMLRNWLAAYLIDSKIVSSATVELNDIFKEASDAISKMEMPEAKINTLNGIAAYANVKSAELDGKTIPMETAVSIQQSAYHHPELLEVK